METRRACWAGRPGLALGAALLCSADRHPQRRPHWHPVWLGSTGVTRPFGPPTLQHASTASCEAGLPPDRGTETGPVHKSPWQR